MESSDRELLIEINGRLLSIEAEQARQALELSQARNELRVMREEQRMLRHRGDTLQTSVYSVLVIVVSFLATLAVFSAFRRH